MSRYTLFGDGVHDDAPAIQELLDARGSLVDLPAPQAHYCIGRTLRLHARQTLRLGPTTMIQLLPDSNCIMVKNDPVDGHEDICLVGGVWNMNNMSQAPNPLYTRSVNTDWTKGAYADDEYLGVPIRFFDVTRLTVSGITIKDPVTFGFQAARLTYFTIENIRFDYNYGNPYAINMDGVHLDGFMRFGCIRNLQGACYDDLLALNADDFYDGPIEDIEVDGIFATDCHSAVRILSAKSNVRRITISRVYGTFYQYCIGFTRFYETHGACGEFDQIVLRDIFAAKAPRLSVYKKDGSFVYPLIYFEKKIHVKSLCVENLHRIEEETAVPTLGISANTRVDALTLRSVTQENALDVPIPLIQNAGEIGRLTLADVSTGGDRLLEGVAEMIVADEGARALLS